MRRFYIIIILIFAIATPVFATEYTAPPAPEEAEKFMPDEVSTFGEDLWYIVKSAIAYFQPSLAQASKVCISVIAVIMLISILQVFTGVTASITQLLGVLSISILLLAPSRALIQLGVDTVMQLSDYGKLLLPVMTAALASQGGTVTSSAIYTGTVFFNALLTTGITRIIVPMIYIYIGLCIASGAIGDETLGKLCILVKWGITWFLKITLYIFTGYLSITGVVSGVTDAAAVKAAKLAITGFVPVVGNIVSDASEAILVGATVMKNSVGIYGLLTILAICIGPFLKIATQYLLIKLTAGICDTFGTKKCTALIADFSSIMGLLLAITGTVSLLLLISTVCLMKGMS